MTDEQNNRPGVDALVLFMAARMASNTSRFRAGEMTLAQWQAQMMADIKASHIAAALAAYGGRDAMNSTSASTPGRGGPDYSPTVWLSA